MRATTSEFKILMFELFCIVFNFFESSSRSCGPVRGLVVGAVLLLRCGKERSAPGVMEH